MAKLKMYSVYDSKINLFAAPFMMRSKGEALRGWAEVTNDETTTICKHPADFTLFELADFDDETGKYTNHATPISLGLAVEFKRQPQSPAPLLDLAAGRKEA